MARHPLVALRQEVQGGRRRCVGDGVSCRVDGSGSRRTRVSGVCVAGSGWLGVVPSPARTAAQYGG
eukprot:scaffold10144_cov88-Isochrysis_galbana.AAC.3